MTFPAAVKADPWWLSAAEIAAEIEQQQPQPRRSVFYQFGDSVLHLNSDDSRLLQTFDVLYGDCEVHEPAPERIGVRCIARRAPELPLLLLTFPEDAKDRASAFMPKRAMRVWSSSVSGWQLTGENDEPIFASNSRHVLIHIHRAWRRFAAEYLVNAMLAGQPDLLGLHAGSLRVHGSGFLVTGRSGSGKTTTSLHLAARGAELLGEEIALVRVSTRELVPFRRSASLREGPRAPELSAALEQSKQRPQAIENDADGVLLRINHTFSSPRSGPAELKAVFFLRRFADRASVEPFRPSLQDLETFGVLAGHEMARSRGSAVRLLVVKQMLDRLPCWLVEVGPPAETANLIERTMEDLRC